MEDNEANRTGVQRSRRNTLGRSEYMKFCWIMSLWIDRVFPWGRRENGSAHYWNALESVPWKLSNQHGLEENKHFISEDFLLPFEVRKWGWARGGEGVLERGALRRK